MPFSSTPVYVGLGDQVEVRYPTPSTWNTQVTVQVQIGTGADPDGITFGTRIPDSRPDNFIFNDQQGSLDPSATSAPQFTNTFQKATTYYSNEILVTGLEIEIPAVATCTTSGPKGTTTGQNAAAAFRINRGGVIGPWQTSGTVRQGDLIKLRATTENWYTTSTSVTLTLSDETWGTNVGLPSSVVSDTWSITTRAQDQNVIQYTFDDYVDVRATEFNTYKTQTISITGIDTDAVLRALSTGDVQVSKDNVNWSQSVTGLVLNDSLYTRIAVKSYTQKSTGTLNVFAVASDTLTGGYENNAAGTYGSGTFSVTQTLGTITDNWQLWTEVDRYPDTISLSPIYTVSDTDEVVATSTNTLNNAEPGFLYLTDFNITGLGVEYATNTYSDLEIPLRDANNTLNPNYITNALPLNTTNVNGKNVELSCVVTQGSAEIRKNNTGNWVQQLFVQNGDEVNLRMTSSTSFNTTLTSTIELIGPPSGGPVPFNNPTNGPTTPTFANKTDTITLKTRLARTTPNPFRAQDVFTATPGLTYVEAVPISGLDLSTTATIVSSSAGMNAQLSLDGVSYSTSLTVPATTSVIYVRATASSNFNTLSSVVYQIGSAQDTFKLYTRRQDWIYTTRFGDGATIFSEYELPDYAENVEFILIGAGGGNGGDDAPNSFGGRGGFGNLVKGTLNLPPQILGDSLARTLKVFAPDSGKSGQAFTAGGVGGLGGFGYATGGNGGNAGPADRSGSGGGGGGSAAIALNDGTLLALAGGGGGAGGAGNDTTVPSSTQNGNYNGSGNLTTNLAGLNLTGPNGQNNTTQGGGGGGAGGGYGTAGVVQTQKIDENLNVIQTSDLDGTGGSGGGAYRNSTYVTLDTTGGFTNFGAGSSESGLIIISYPPQDITPNPYFFPQIENANPATTYESQKVQITGITGNVLVTVLDNSSTVRVCDENGLNCSPYNLSVFVRNGQYIQVRATTGGNYFSPYATTVTVGNTQEIFTITTGAPPDRVPTDFIIPNKNNQPISTFIESDIITVGGINVPVSITASNGAQISICTAGVCDGFAPSSRIIENGQSFKIGIFSSDSFETTVQTSVAVGDGTPVIWQVRTLKEPDTTPSSFVFSNLSNQPLETTVFSNSRTIQGIDTIINFTVSNGASVILNGDVNNPFDPIGNSVTVQVQNFDIVQLKYTTSNIVGESLTFGITAGTYTTSWTVTNTGQLGTSPTPFTFTPVIATGPLQLTQSQETITISGLGTAVGFFLTNNAEASINGGGYQTYTFSTPGSISNGSTLRVRLRSSEIAGFTLNTTIYVGSYNTLFSVTTPAPVASPILGQWYSGPSVVKNVGNDQIKYATKYDGLPVGSIMPVFKDNTQADQWGVSEDKLNGKADSRFPGWIYCDGRYVSPTDYPVLYSVFTNAGSNTPPYGSNLAGDFRLPDFRNRKVLGTGTIDGQSPASPAVTPEYGPTKLTTGLKGFNIPGSFGGMWYIDTIADPGVDELEQVFTPGSGLPAQDSPFFSVGQIITTGYTDISDRIEFLTSGNVTGSVSLRDTKIFDVPFHQHFMVTGQADPGNFKGRVAWNSYGGANGRIAFPRKTTGLARPPIEGSITINLWGYADIGLNNGAANDITGDYIINNFTDGVITQNSATYGPVWVNEIGVYGECRDPGFKGNYLNPNRVGIPDPQQISYSCDFAGVLDFLTADCNEPTVASIHPSVTILQPNSSIYGEIAQYITPTAISASGDEIRFIGAVDIPRRFITVAKYTPPTRRGHTHYVSLSAITDPINNFSFGNSDGAGTAYLAAPYQTSVDVVFSSVDVGLEVLPGIFTLNSNKQLIPVPEFAPQDKVPLVTPYTQVRWLIKAY